MSELLDVVRRFDDLVAAVERIAGALDVIADRLDDILAAMRSH